MCIRADYMSPPVVSTRALPFPDSQALLNTHVGFGDFSPTVLFCSTHSVQFFFFFTHVFHSCLNLISCGLMSSICTWEKLLLTWTLQPLCPAWEWLVSLITVEDLNCDSSKHRKEENVDLEFSNCTFYSLGMFWLVTFVWLDIYIIQRHFCIQLTY